VESLKFTQTLKYGKGFIEIPNNVACNMILEDGAYVSYGALKIVDDIYVKDEVKLQEKADEESIESTNKIALKYLADTDWYIIRYQETSVEIPQEILDARAEARTKVI